MAKDIAVIIPLLNEEENIPALCDTLDTYAAGKPYSIEVLFVDDGSTDGSVPLLKAYAFQNLDARVIRLSKNYGSHAAIRAGISRANACYCMFFSADLQEPVDLIGRLYSKMQEGYDLVGVQKGRVQVGGGERFFSHLYAWLIRHFAVSSFPAGGINNCMFSKKIQNALNENIEPNSSIFLQILTLGYRTAFITADYLPRAAGKSKWTLGKKIKMLIDSFVAFSYMPIRMISLMGVLLFLFGFLFAIFIIVVKVFNFFPLSLGWPTLISVLMLGFGLTNLALGIIAEYQWRALDASRNRPVFLIDEESELGRKNPDGEQAN